MTRTRSLSLVLLLIGLLVGLGFAEIALRLIGRPHPRVVGWRAVHGHPPELNQLGYRGQPIEYTDEDFVVVLLGDSQVEARACSYAWMPERRLQSHLSAAGKRTRVFSLGASGYGQDQQLLALREYVTQYRADLVVAWFTPSNDLVDNVYSTGPLLRGVLKPTFWLSGNELKGPNLGLGETQSPRFRVVGLVERLYKGSAGIEWLDRLPPAYEPQRVYSGTSDTTWQILWNRLRAKYGHDDMADERIRLSMRLVPNSDRMRYALTLTQRLLEEIAETAKRSGAPFILFRTSGTEDDMKRTGSVQVINGLYYRESYQQLETNLEQLSAPFESVVVPVTLRDWPVGPKDGHLNEHAVDQVMRDLAIQLAPFITQTQTAP